MVNVRCEECETIQVQFVRAYETIEGFWCEEYWCKECGHEFRDVQINRD